MIKDIRHLQSFRSSHIQHLHGSQVHLQHLIRGALQIGQSIFIGDGKAIWDYTHIADITLLYELLLTKVLSGTKLPCGEKGIYFTETGNFSWLEVAEGITRAGKNLGAWESEEVTSVTLEEGAQLVRFLAKFVELGFASKSVVLSY